MQYRKLGKTSDEVSVLGMGCLRLPRATCDGKECVDLEMAEDLIIRAYEKGINYFDCAPAYCDGKCEQIVGNAVKKFRKEVMLASKIPLQEVKKTEDYRRWLENSLDRMQTDYLDNYLFWGINRDMFEKVIIPFDLLEEGRKAKEEGLIRRMSVSVHDTPENIIYLLEQAEKCGIAFDTVLCQYNLLDRKNTEVLAFAKERGIGTLVMGPVAGGRLAWPSDLGEKLGEYNQVPTSELALRYVMENENVDCTLSGMSSLAMLDENTALADKIGDINYGFEEHVLEAVEKLEELSQLYCTGCDYCQPCPAQIKISKILYLVNCDRIYGLHTYARQEFERYCKNYGIPFEACVNCGQCEKRCPQSLKIRQELKKACEIL